MTGSELRGHRSRLFWRIYRHGLGLLVASAIAVFAVVAVLGGPRPMPGGPWRVVRSVGRDLAPLLDQPEALARRVEELAQLFDASIAVYRVDGRRLAAAGDSPPGPGEPPPLAGGPHHGPPPRPEIERRLTRLLITVPIAGGPVGAYARVSRSYFGSAVPFATLAGVLAVLAALSYPLAASIVRPIERLTETARALGRGDLSVRTGLARRDEVGALATAFDDMAERIERSLQNERDLMLAVSHELRTPLARIRVALELAEERPTDPAEVQARLGHIGEDLAEVQGLLDQVLEVARLQHAGGTEALPRQRQRIAVGKLVDEAAQRFHSAHPERVLTVDAPVTLPEIEGDAVLLRRTIGNLLDNAAKYSDAGAAIEIAAAGTEAGISIEVRDRGLGVDASDLPHLFEPFFRADRSRTRATGGVGLGLTLCKRVVESHGGSITAANREGGGLVVRLVLPSPGHGGSEIA